MKKPPKRSELWLATARNIIQDAGYQEYQGPNTELVAGADLVSVPMFQRDAVIGNSVYKTPYKATFFLADRSRFPNGLVVQVNFQESSGSTDRKFHFVVDSLLLSGRQTVLIVGGDGISQGCRSYLARRSAEEEMLTLLDHVDDLITLITD